MTFTKRIGLGAELVAKSTIGKNTTNLRWIDRRKPMATSNAAIAANEIAGTTCSVIVNGEAFDVRWTSPDQANENQW